MLGVLRGRGFRKSILVALLPSVEASMPMYGSVMSRMTNLLCATCAAGFGGLLWRFSGRSSVVVL
eukprot:5103530-Amphidinium_carterae.1